MSDILKKIKDDLKISMKREIKLRKMNITNGSVFNFNTANKTVSRAIISMFPEIGKKPADATDDDTLKLLKKYINQQKERLVYQLGFLVESDVRGKSGPEVKKLVSDIMKSREDELTSTEIRIAESYLPKKATEKEITEWILANIDFTQFKNKMQAMGPTMKHFIGADGNFVKSIILNIGKEK